MVYDGSTQQNPLRKVSFLLCRTLSGLDRCSLNVSMLSRYAFVMTSGPVDGRSIGSQASQIFVGRQQLDGDGAVPTPHRQRICQTAINLRSRIPDVMSAREAHAALIYQPHFVTYVAFSSDNAVRVAPQNLFCRLLALRLAIALSPDLTTMKKNNLNSHPLIMQMKQVCH